MIICYTVFSCHDEEYENGNPDSLSIQPTFMDNNYYKYFVNGEEDKFLNFLMGISGTTQNAIGVEGGLGVFGSYARDRVIIPFNP